MRRERYQQIKELFQLAVERDAGQRTAFLEQACAGNGELRAEVERLLEYDEQEPRFMETPGYQASSIEGQRIGPYKVLYELGQGGMGAVYLADRADGEYKKQVAIKIVKRGMDSDAILRRFRNERQILANLDHPNIAKLLDGGTTEDGLSYFVMENVEGLPIDAYCQTHRLPTVERLKLFRTVCSAVQCAHQHQVIHRDIKPGNILVTAQGIPKLLDFGIAKVLNSDFPGRTGDRTAGPWPMTPQYASPEQVRGEAITALSDVYSLGVMLYELLTGHLPYRVSVHTPQEAERVICEREPQKPSEMIASADSVQIGDAGPGAPTTPWVSVTWEGQPEKLRRRLVGDLDNIVLKALRKEPERRYASVEQFSDDIRRHLEGLPITARKDGLGYRSTKFIQRNKTAVLAAASTAVVLLLVATVISVFSARGRIESIAVLPFVNVDADPNSEYLSRGIAETLRNDLSQLPNLKVLSRLAVFPQQGKEQDLQAVGRALGVEAMVTGRLLQRDDNLSISAELVDVRSNRQLWGDQYTRKSSDVLAVQEEIARRISEQLRLRLSGAEKQRLTKRYAANTEAYHSYLKGRYYRLKVTPEGLKRAVEHFERAVKLDPNYALAYAWLGESFEKSSLLSVLPSQEANVKAKAAALKALELDDTLAEAHSTLGLINLYYDWDWPAAELELKRAIALEPEEARVHQAYATSLMRFGRFEEALREIQRARELDPVNLEIQCWVALVLYFSGRYDEALALARQTLDMDPSYNMAIRVVAKASLEKRLYGQAIAAFQKGIAQGASPQQKAELANAYAVAGQRGEATKLLTEMRELAKRKAVSSFDIAAIYVGLGDMDQAFEWLQKSYVERERWMVHLHSPVFDSIRADPRFVDLVRRVGLWQ